MQSTPFIKTIGLTKQYKNFTAVKQINFSLYAGEIYGLVGKNGTGKTTYFKIIMGGLLGQGQDDILTGCNAQGNPKTLEYI